MIGIIILLRRKGDVINVGGNKVSPEEIENVCRKLSGIADCGAIPVADPITDTGESSRQVIQGANRVIAFADSRAIIKAERRLNTVCGGSYMNIGTKIRQLRFRSGLTQEQLAVRLGISPQSVSKWENAVTMPDIALLPSLAGELGVSIDELFDLSVPQRLHRIEQRMQAEEELPGDIFREYEEFLSEQLAKGEDRYRIISLLAHLYHHRMSADAKRVSQFAREAILLRPEQKDCQWLLQMAEGQAPWDWNVWNHGSAIDFYKEVIRRDKVQPRTPLPYYYLLDQLIADRRTEEAAAYLDEVQKLPAHKPCLIPVYRAHIALAEFDAPEGERIMAEALEIYGEDPVFLFEAAQYYAGKCAYEKAIRFYEAAWEAEDDQKPRFTDALQGIARICEIRGEYREAAAVQQRILHALREEWNLRDDDREVLETERERNRLLQKAVH